MESTSVQELLSKWGFNKYVEIFVENEVDIIALPLLDDQQIKSLIPTIGPQANFKKALADWKVTLQQNQEDKDNTKIDCGIEKIVQAYDIDDLTPSFNSPIISTDLSSSASSISLSYSDEPSAGSSQHYEVSIQDLKFLLQTCQDGKLLLKNRKEPLGEQLRKLLMHKIAEELLKNDPKAPVTKELFPAENPSIYFTKAPEGPGRAHGRLYDAVTN